MDRLAHDALQLDTAVEAYYIGRAAAYENPAIENYDLMHDGYTAATQNEITFTAREIRWDRRRRLPVLKPLVIYGPLVLQAERGLRASLQPQLPNNPSKAVPREIAEVMLRVAFSDRCENHPHDTADTAA